MKIIVNADDYGRSRGITDNISECYDHGVLNSVSVPVLGHAYDYAFHEYRSRPKLRLALHLDLVENKPLSPAHLVPLLVNKQGDYHNSFLKLWLRYLLSNSQTRRQFKIQIKHELRAQLNKFQKTFGKHHELNLDSHQHLHMLPFVFDILIDLANEYHISYIRLANEPFFWCFDLSSAVRSYLGPNLIKHFLLKSLTSKYRKILIQKKIKTADYFIGVLFTGYTTIGSVKAALAKIPIHSNSSTIELLFHACKAVPGEEHHWQRIPGLRRYYYSPFRDIEKRALIDPRLNQILKDFTTKYHL